VLVSVQDRCKICAERTIGSKIILDAPDGTCICIAFALFEVYLYWSFILAWSGYAGYCLYSYEEYCFIYNMRVLSYLYVEVLHLFYIMSLFSLWNLCLINNLILNLLCIIMTCILLWLNWCLIKWMTCLDSLLAEIYSHPIIFFRCLIWMLWLKGWISGTSSLFHPLLEIIKMFLTCCNKLVYQSWRSFVV